MGRCLSWFLVLAFIGFAIFAATLFVALFGLYLLIILAILIW